VVTILINQYHFNLGTYATVYDGWYNGTEVAVKRFKNADPANFKAYQTEMEVMSWLRENGSHPNIVHMFGGYANDKHCFIILEKARHGNVASYLRKHKGKLSIADKLRWALQVAQVIAHLHFHGPEVVLHRDIKAENILITHMGEDSTVKVCDFG
jgi:serine/threonine protein kinase